MTLVVDLDARQLDAYARNLDKIGKDLPAAVDRAVNLAANEGKRFIIEKTPKRFGHLRRGFQVARVGQMAWRIFNLVEYLIYVEEGNPNWNWRWPGTGPKMMANSVKEIKERLDKNVGDAIRMLLARRS